MLIFKSGGFSNKFRFSVSLETSEHCSLEATNTELQGWAANINSLAGSPALRRGVIMLQNRPLTTQNRNTVYTLGQKRTITEL